MKKYFIALVIISALAVFVNYAPQALAGVVFSNIKISAIENGIAKLEWTTNEPTRAIINFGEKSDNLDRETGYGAYDYRHESTLAGLKKNKTYYYKITAIDKLQNKAESFTQSFSTQGMKSEEIVKPVFMEQKVLQVINEAAALSWTTDEETKAIVYYRAESEKSPRQAGYGRFDRYHEIFISGLKPGNKYYAEISAQDRSGNKNSRSVSFYTSGHKEKIPNLEILDIKPLSFDSGLISSRDAMIMWRTNFVSKSYIVYGDNANNIRKRVDASNFLSLEHQARLTDLEPGKTYFFKISAYGSFFNRSATTKVMSVTAAPLAKKIGNGSLVKGSGYKVYVISGAERLWIETADVFNKLGYKWNWIEKVDDSVLSQYKEGKKISNAKVRPNGTLIKYPNSVAVYLLENGKKRPFSSAGAFIKRGYSWDRIIVVPKEERYRDGEYL